MSRNDMMIKIMKAKVMNKQILVPFRTWRNTNTGKAAAELSQLFNYNIPLRWSTPTGLIEMLTSERMLPSSRLQSLTPA